MCGICDKCGASSAENDVFCRNCGAKQVASAESSVGPRLCANCGSPVLAQARFCEKCGTSLTQGAAPSTSTPVAVGHHQVRVASGFDTPFTATPSPARSNASKFVMIAVAVFIFFLMLGMGSRAYVAYRAKEKAHAIEEAYKH